MLSSKNTHGNTADGQVRARKTHQTQKHLLTTSQLEEDEEVKKTSFNERRNGTEHTISTHTYTYIHTHTYTGGTQEYSLLDAELVYHQAEEALGAHVETSHLQGHHVKVSHVPTQGRGRVVPLE